MSILVIYDATGRILSQMGGDVQEPTGVPFMWVNIPQGMYIKNIDVSDASNHIPVFEDYPETEIDVLRKQLETQEQAILELSMMIGGAINV